MTSFSTVPEIVRLGHIYRVPHRVTQWFEPFDVFGLDSSDSTIKLGTICRKGAHGGLRFFKRQSI